MDKSEMDGYTRGQVDAFELYGRVCSKKENCEKCAIGIVKNAGMTCAEYAKAKPGTFLSLLNEMDKGYVTYAEEYGSRFPDAKNSVETLVALGICRKAIFEGYLLCDVDNSLEENQQICLDCWNTKYIADVSLTPEEREEYNRQLLELAQQAQEEDNDDIFGGEGF